MLIVGAVMFLIALALFSVFFRIALRNSRKARANALDPNGNAVFRGPILLNADGGFNGPGLYEIVVLPEQIQIRVRGGFPQLAGGEWFLDPAEVEVQPFEARFLWRMARRPGIRLRYKPEGAVVSFLVLTSREGRDAELMTALDAVTKGAQAKRGPKAAS